MTTRLILISEPDVDGPLDRPIFTDLFSKSRLIGILLVFPNAASLWLAIVSSVIFTGCIVAAVTLFDPPMRLILPIGILGGAVALWALVSEVIALMSEVYAQGRMDEFYRLKDELEEAEGNTILSWPLAPRA
jgi:hypothetical protein